MRATRTVEISTGLFVLLGFAALFFLVTQITNRELSVNGNSYEVTAQFENVVTTYNVTRIDLDVEDNSLTNSAGIDRRNKAIKLVEDWAAANGRTVQFSYTLPTSRTAERGR